MWASSLQTAITGSVCPFSVCVQVAVVKSQILIVLSLLALARVWASSLQTAFTRPVCPDSVCVQVAVVKSQILIVLSLLALARVWASSLQTAVTTLVCPCSVLLHGESLLGKGRKGGAGGRGCFSFGGTVQYIEESNIYLCFVVYRLKRGLVT